MARPRDPLAVAFDARLEELGQGPDADVRAAAIQSPAISILLDHEQSEIFANAGECFAVVHRHMEHRQPDINRWWIISLIPCSIPQADAAARVARGLSTERKPRISKP